MKGKTYRPFLAARNMKLLDALREAQARYPESPVWLHPEDAKELPLTAGDVLTDATLARGMVYVEVRDGA